MAFYRKMNIHEVKGDSNAFYEMWPYNGNRPTRTMDVRLYTTVQPHRIIEMSNELLPNFPRVRKSLVYTYNFRLYIELAQNDPFSP